MTGKLAGQYVLITGAARGIGRATAKAFAAAGATVAASDIDDTGAVVEDIAVAGGVAIGARCDVADEASVLSLFEGLDADWPRIDLVVSSAGIIDARPLAETSGADFDRVLNVNLRGTFLIGREALKRMQRAESGRFIAIASDLGQSGRETYSAYVASKHGVIGLVRSWAKEFAPDIQVNAICPGPIDTDMLGSANMLPEWRQKELEIPAARFGTPHEVAALAVFLAGPAATFITGQCLGINGGSVMA